MTNENMAELTNNKIDKLSTIKNITILADSNIASLNDFFNDSTLGQLTEHTVEIITVAGRDIDAALLTEVQPDVLLIRSVTKVNEALLADNNSVQFVGSATIGTDHVDQDYLASRNITFANAAGCSKHSVAQYVLTAVFTLCPQYWQQSASLTLRSEEHTSAIQSPVPSA